MQQILISIILIAFLSGCGTTPYSEPMEEHVFDTPLGEKQVTATGENIVMEGRFIRGKAIKIPAPIERILPGSMFVPFPMNLGRGKLRMTKITAKWEYYCGEPDKVSASFPGLGSVISHGDCVGIRLAKDGGAHQWVVDNSNHNGYQTIWSKGMSDADIEKYKPYETRLTFDIESLITITFDGFYGGQLHFTWSEQEDDYSDSHDFVFDFDGEPLTVAIKGSRFKVLSASSSELVYEWEHYESLY